MQNRRMRFGPLLLTLAVSAGLALNAFAQKTLTLAEAVALAKQQNPEVAIARKQVEAARGGRVEARSGRLPAVISSGLLRKRDRMEWKREC